MPKKKQKKVRQRPKNVWVLLRTVNGVTIPTVHTTERRAKDACLNYVFERINGIDDDYEDTHIFHRSLKLKFLKAGADAVHKTDSEDFDKFLGVWNTNFVHEHIQVIKTQLR